MLQFADSAKAPEHHSNGNETPASHAAQARIKRRVGMLKESQVSPAMVANFVSAMRHARR